MPEEENKKIIAALNQIAKKTRSMRLDLRRILEATPASSITSPSIMEIATGLDDIITLIDQASRAVADSERKRR